MRSWRTSCRRSPRWARRWRSSTSIATAGRTSTSPTARKARANRLYRNSGDGTFEDVAGAAGRGRPQSRRAPACRWARSGATTTTTASRICSSIAGAGPSCFTTTAARASRGSASGRPAGLGQHQHRGLARLRSRRPARSLRRRLLARVGEPLEARRHADHAGELRVREQRRPQVPVPQSRRRQVRGSQRAGRARLAALGAGGGGRRSARHRLSGPVHRQRLRRLGAVRQRGRAVPRGRPRDGRRLRAEERHERVGRRRVQPGPLRDLQDEHLRGRHPAPGQQPVGAVGAGPTARRSTRTSRARWASISAAGASARSSAI